MDFNFTQDENDFRKEIKDWLSKNLSQRISNKVKKFQRLDKNDYEEFMKALSAKGWLAVNWPKEHGGTGWSNTQKHIFEDEIVKAGAPSCLLYTSPSPRDNTLSRMPSSA